MSWDTDIAGVDRDCQDLLGAINFRYAPAVGQPVDMLGIFDQAQTPVATSGTGVEQMFHRVTAQLADFAGLDPTAEKTKALVTAPYPGGQTFRVHEAQTDVQGQAVLWLHKVRS